MSLGPVSRGGRIPAFLFSAGIAAILLFAVLAQELSSEPLQPILDVSKVVNKTEATAGSMLGYTIVITNSGVEFGAATLTDTLPAGLTYEAGSLSVSGGGSFGESNGVITWTGAVNVGLPVVLTFETVLDSNLPDGSVITNSVEVTGTGELLTDTAATTIFVQTQTDIYLPIVVKPYPLPEAVTLNPVDRPNSSNQWVISWSGGGEYVSNFELQESHNADFSELTVYTFDSTTTAVQASHAPSLRNTYYYRLRAVGSGGYGPWSSTQSVVGAYRDDFNDSSSGWAIRRTTLIEKVDSWYESYGSNENRLIIRVEDSHDWGIVSPLAPAPDLPYAIEYRAEPAQLGDRISHGATFGGDWNGQGCPDYSSLEGVYEHTNCFNHFYNTNIVWSSILTLYFERVDYLFWCPTCSGSPMKRLTDDQNSWFSVGPIPNVNPNGANTWRIEVRDDGIKLFANDQQYGQNGDTTWVNSPYFGIFASTFEFSNSTWRINYYQVLPLDQ